MYFIYLFTIFIAALNRMWAPSSKNETAFKKNRGSSQVKPGHCFERFITCHV